MDAWTLCFVASMHGRLATLIILLDLQSFALLLFLNGSMLSSTVSICYGMGGHYCLYIWQLTHLESHQQ